MKNLVVYHRADFDGLFSAAVCKKFMPDAELIGWDFGDPPVYPKVDVPSYTKIYVVDLPLECLGFGRGSMPKSWLDRIVWIDHHKSSIENWKGVDVAGIRMDGVAACRLCWEWFLGGDFQPFTYSKEDFVNRVPKEPYALRLAGEFDVWDMRDENALPFQFGLTAKNPSVDALVSLLSMGENTANGEVSKLIEAGKSVLRWQQQFASDVCGNYGYVREFHGLKFLVLASAHTRNSLWFPEEAIPDGVDALMAWRYDGEVVHFSLYHRPGRTDLDLSEIAVQYGGGGHRGACGFRLHGDLALEIVS